MSNNKGGILRGEYIAPLMYALYHHIRDTNRFKSGFVERGKALLNSVSVIYVFSKYMIMLDVFNYIIYLEMN